MRGCCGKLCALLLLCGSPPQGLLPERRYEAQVRAVNPIGAGPYSSPGPAVWTQGRPSRAPARPRLASAGVTSLTLEWGAAATEVRLVAGCDVCRSLSQLIAGCLRVRRCIPLCE